MGLWIRWTHGEIIALSLSENELVCLIHIATTRSMPEKCPVVHLISSSKLDALKRLMSLKNTIIIQ